MPPRRKILPALLVLLAFASSLIGQQAITIDRNSPLGFGSLVSTTTGSVTVSPDGGRWASGGTTMGSSAGASPASFSVSGEPGLVFAVILPSSATLSSDTSSMTIDAFTSSPDGTGVLDASGQREVRVGATLHVVGQQPAGAYSGTFGVTVAYN
jgi:hypothetical protein